MKRKSAAIPLIFTAIPGSSWLALREEDQVFTGESNEEKLPAVFVIMETNPQQSVLIRLPLLQYPA